SPQHQGSRSIQRPLETSRHLREKVSYADAVQSVLDSAEVVCATLVGCGARDFEGRSFDLILLDEASQSTEPRSLIPISRLSPSGRLALVGDHQQLPPVCVSREAESAGLGLSLFSRLLQLPPLRPAALRVQYRMHPLIRQWPSEAFYRGTLVDGESVVGRPLLPGFPWPAAGPIAFIEEPSPGRSWQNPGECALALAVVNRLLERVPAESIAVISPYRGQVGLLNLELPARGLRALTVDGYQGNEAPLVVFSCVRSNAESTIGFLGDKRRLNVALTRAQMGLIVIGNPATLRHSDHWWSWLRFVEKHGLKIGADQLSSARKRA
ncbi:unnamed protein product, partial [Prorocentrum cordatum]